MTSTSLGNVADAPLEAADEGFDFDLDLDLGFVEVVDDEVGTEDDVDDDVKDGLG